MVISIPKGRYLPVFEARSEDPATVNGVAPRARTRHHRLLQALTAVAVLFGAVIVWLGYLLFESRPPSPQSAIVAATLPPPTASQSTPSRPVSNQAVATAGPDEIRIAAGHEGAPFVDAWGHRWEADRYFEGGARRPGPKHFFPPVADENPFRTMREALAADLTVPQAHRQFRYDIPVRPGVYQLWLYFADALRQPEGEQREDAQNRRHFQINLNGHPLLVDFDPVADAGAAAVDVRVFRDIYPAADGRLHFEFLSSWGYPAFVSALELVPGIPGKLKPIRIAARPTNFVDAEGVHWARDNYFIDGRTLLNGNTGTLPRINPLYIGERHGNFSYSIPVAPGSYTVKLHFLESYFSPFVSTASCQGVGCRVFDVTGNGMTLLESFDILQTNGRRLPAGGA